MTMNRILIVGAGFAGMYAALSSARVRHAQGVSPDMLEITVVAPAPHLVVRPRLYERAPETMVAPLAHLFAAVDVRYEQGRVEGIDAPGNTVSILRADGQRHSLRYDRLVLAAGSQAAKPEVAGLATYGFSVDQMEDAIALDTHLKSLGSRPLSAARDTVVVAGGGFTGIEVATEMPSRLREVLGQQANVRVVIVDRNAAIAAAMGPESRPLVEKALRETGVEMKLGVSVMQLDQSGVVLSDGQIIEAWTVVWTGGMRANPLTAQLAAERDTSGRLMVDRTLRVPQAPRIFATGDMANTLTDDLGHRALMSCQHAIRLGSHAGFNAAADVLGVPLTPYQQNTYVTCLDLGPSNALFTRGWESKVELRGEEAKAMKREINTRWIYPPPANREDAFEAADRTRRVD